MIRKINRSPSRILLRLVALFTLGLALCGQAPAITARCYPNSVYVKGGLPITLDGFTASQVVQAVFFGDVPVTDLTDGDRFCYSDDLDEGGFCIYTYRCSAPEQAQAGPVSVTVVYQGGFQQVLDRPFTYYDAPVIDSITPNQNSILPDDDNDPVTIKAFAVSLEPGLRVFFGDRTATEVSAVINSPWVVITCLPPPFPGGKHPLPVDVRVVNADGSEGKSESAFTYQTIVPEVLEINGGTLPPWKSGLGMDFYIEARLIDGSGYKVYFNGILGADTQTYISRGVKYLYTKAPAFPPGTADLTVVNGDGGVFFKSDAIVISGTPSTDFHPGDRDRDFRFNLSEVLRVVQFYNSGGLHCDPTSEDGYAPGVGSDTSCTPYPADNAPFDWNLGLTELLGIIQFYNLHCYQPCPAAPGTYCPPD